MILSETMVEKYPVKSAEFVKSSADWKDCPTETYPEIAFIGRSNVGKSSLINMITKRKSLAKISGKPGKTRLINHFLINEEWYLVDLPGYGWAKVSKKEQAKWEDMISHYLLNRKNLLAVFVLVDSRLDPQPLDLEMIQFLGENQVPVVIAFTKSDKKGKNAVASKVAKFKKTLKQQWEELPTSFVTSSQDGRGRESLLEFIYTECL